MDKKLHLLEEEKHKLYTCDVNGMVNRSQYIKA